MSFVTYALRNFHKVGSLFPTTQRVSKSIATKLPDGCRVVVEFGAGDGAVTRPILARLGSDARLICSELSRELADGLRQWGDKRMEVVTTDAREVASGLRARFPEGVDAIVSGIPISFLPPEDADRFIDDCAAALSPRGKLVIYQVSPKVHRLLKPRFREVRWNLEMANLPPYQVFVAQAPSMPQSQKSGESATPRAPEASSSFTMHRGSITS